MVWAKDKFHDGLRVLPNFEKSFDDAQRSSGIRIPDRHWKRKALGLYHSNLFEDHVNGRLFENQQQRAGHDITNLEHSMSNETTPATLQFVQPSPSVDDVVWDLMHHQAKAHQETMVEQAMRHRVDLEAQQQLGEIRRANLGDMYFQGRRSTILGGEVPIEMRSVYKQVAGPGYGQVISTIVPRHAPPAMPRAAGYGYVPELPANRELNGDPRLTGFMVGGGKTLLKEGDGYDAARRASNL